MKSTLTHSCDILRPTLASIILAAASMVFFLAGLGATAAEPPKVNIEYFRQPGCRECELVSRIVMPQLEERCRGRYAIAELDIGVKADYLRLVAYQDRLGVRGNEPVSMVVDGKALLDGYPKIERELVRVVEERMAEIDAGVDLEPAMTDRMETDTALVPNTNNSAPTIATPPPPTDLLERRAERMTLTAVVVAGLVDGVNPCAISTLILLASFLATSRGGTARIIAAGAAYCFASYLTYFLIGFGLIRVLTTLESFKTIRACFEYGIAAVLVVMAVVSLRDAWLHHKGDGGMILALPEPVKRAIHSVVTRGVRYSIIIPGAFVAGVAATALESVCTGQVYVPTLALLAKEGAQAGRWISYLALYNLLFILPLFGVLAAVLLGVRSLRMVEWNRRGVVPAKVAMGALFLAMAVLVLWL